MALGFGGCLARGVTSQHGVHIQAVDDHETIPLSVVCVLSKAWAAQVGPREVGVNAISPGPTRTEGTEGMGEALDRLASLAPPAVRPPRGDRLGNRLEPTRPSTPMTRA